MKQVQVMVPLAIGLCCSLSISFMFSFHLHSFNTSGPWLAPERFSGLPVVDHVNPIGPENATSSDIESPRLQTNESRRNNGSVDPDRQPILDILRRGGYDIESDLFMDEGLMRSLPSWSTVTSFYGEPRIIGLDTCEKYRQEVPPSLRSVGVAGMFNSGTNMLFEILLRNCVIANSTKSATQMEWQVPWGKHYPAFARGQHTVKAYSLYNVSNTLAVVSIRDPYTWMQSMCRQNYGAQFDHSKQFCPNLVPYPADIKAHPRYGRMDYIPVWITYSKAFPVQKHKSLAHLYNEWNLDYLTNFTNPRVIVRMEDILFHSEKTIGAICECAGGKMLTEGVRLYPKIANHNNGIDLGNDTRLGLLRSVIRYGNTSHRRAGYPPFQLQAAKKILDQKLLDIFGYPTEEP